MIQVIEQFIVNYLYISKLRTGVELTYFCELQLFGLSLWKKKEMVSGCKCHNYYNTWKVSKYWKNRLRLTGWKRVPWSATDITRDLGLHRPGL